MEDEDGDESGRPQPRRKSNRRRRWIGGRRRRRRRRRIFKEIGKATGKAAEDVAKVVEDVVKFMVELTSSAGIWAEFASTGYSYEAVPGAVSLNFEFSAGSSQELEACRWPHVQAHMGWKWPGRWYQLRFGRMWAYIIAALIGSVNVSKANPFFCPLGWCHMCPVISAVPSRPCVALWTWWMAATTARKGRAVCWALQKTLPPYLAGP